MTPEDARLSKTNEARLSAVEAGFLSMAEWRTEHREDAKRREAKIEEMSARQIKIEGTIKLIFEKITNCTMDIKKQSEANVQKEKDLKDAHDKFNKNVLTIILFVIGSIATFLVAWGSLNTNVEAHSIKLKRVDKHIEEDEARWIIFPIEHQREKLHE